MQKNGVQIPELPAKTANPKPDIRNWPERRESGCVKTSQAESSRVKLPLKKNFAYLAYFAVKTSRARTPTNAHRRVRTGGCETRFFK